MKYLFTFILCSIALVSFSQNDETVNPEWKKKGDVEWGLLAACSSNTISEDDVFGDDSDIVGSGYVIGATSDYFFNKNWSIRTRANFEHRGFDFNLSADYLTFALDANWHFGKNRRWNLHFGPNYSAVLNSNGFLKNAVGTDFGIGLIIPISGLRFFIELDGVTDFNGFETILTDINGNNIGSRSSSINRSTISFGIHF